jgi:hypothetical protein
MAKPFTTCPKYGWTERIASGGPCKKCVDEAAPPPKGILGGLFGLTVKVSDYLPDDEILVNPATLKKLQEWYSDAERR